MAERLALLGWSRAGTHVLRALGRTGAEVVGVWNRTPRSFGEFDRHALNAVPDLGTALAARAPTLIILATADGAIRGLAEALAASPSLWRHHPLVLHLSGLHDSTILGALAQAGAVTGSLHPLRSYPVHATDDRGLEGAYVGVESGDPSTVVRLMRVAAAAGARPFEIASGAKIDYHLAAVHASNHLAAVFDASCRHFERAGLASELARAVAAELGRGTLENLAKSGAEAALTGPVVRGDVATVARHLETLPPGADRAFYLACARATLALARRAHADRAVAYTAMQKLLEDGA